MEILVQIVHIEGPRKGEIDETEKSVITVGRNPSCDVVFPKDLRVVSRKHAEIIRQGNSFLLVNHSPNGCFIRGKEATNVYLKQGDVVSFAETGPKVSFLYTVAPVARLSSNMALTGSTPVRAKTSHAGSAASSRVKEKTKIETAPFTIQYGTAIKSFKKGSVSLGKDESNDFVVSHARVFGFHAELYFSQGQYFIRDLTPGGEIFLNDRPLQAPTPLQDNDVITLGEGGPQLKHIGSGRFSEVI